MAVELPLRYIDDQRMINKDIYSIINRLIGLRVGYGTNKDEQFLHWRRSK